MVTVLVVIKMSTIDSTRNTLGLNKYRCMKKLLTLSAVFAALLLAGCGTVDSAYNSAKGIGQSAVGGVGNIVGNGTADASKTLGVASDAAGKVLSGGGKVIGGAFELVGGVVKGTSDVVAPAAAPTK